MPDSDKSFGQAVKQEPSDKLHSADGDQLSPFFLSVFSAKAHHIIFNRFDAAVSNRHPVGVASQVFKHMYGPFDRFANTDDPSFGKKPGFKRFIAGMVLNGVPDLMRGNHYGRKRFATADFVCQANGFSGRRNLKRIN